VEYGAGAQLSGQQGYTNEQTKAFELAEPKRITKPDGAVDDTETLPGKKFDRYVPNGAPTGPKGFRPSGNKRRRPEDVRMETRETEDHVALNYD
jgi:hypothetical protein